MLNEVKHLGCAHVDVHEILGNEVKHLGCAHVDVHEILHVRSG